MPVNVGRNIAPAAAVGRIRSGPYLAGLFLVLEVEAGELVHDERVSLLARRHRFGRKRQPFVGRVTDDGGHLDEPPICKFLVRVVLDEVVVQRGIELIDGWVLASWKGQVHVADSSLKCHSIHGLQTGEVLAARLFEQCIVLVLRLFYVAQGGCRWGFCYCGLEELVVTSSIGREL